MPFGFKNINSLINILSKIVYYAMILYIAVIFSHLFWWIFAPENPKIDYNTFSIKAFDNAEKFVVNRNPFGIMVESKPNAEVKPTIASLIKITGLYVNDEKNSFVFYQLNGKNNLAKIGDKLDTAVIKTIKSNGIVITENGNDFNIDLLKENKNNDNYYTASNDSRLNDRSGLQKNENYSKVNNEYIPHDTLPRNLNNINSNNVVSNNNNVNHMSNNNNSNNNVISPSNMNNNANINKNKTSEDEFNRKKDQLIQEFVNYKESKK